MNGVSDLVFATEINANPKFFYDSCAAQGQNGISKCRELGFSVCAFKLSACVSGE
jgi:hypothetical protein